MSFRAIITQWKQHGQVILGQTMLEIARESQLNVATVQLEYFDVAWYPSVFFIYQKIQMKKKKIPIFCFAFRKTLIRKPI